MPTVKLDMRDPATKAVVDGWEDDTEYVIRTGEGPNRAVCEVVQPEEEEPAPEGEGETATGAPGPAAVSAAMGG